MAQLEAPRKLLTRICVCPPDDAANLSEKVLYFISTFFLVITQLMGIVAGMLFVFKFITIDIEGSLFVALVYLNHCSLLYMGLIAFILREEFSRIFDDLSDIHDENNDEQLSRCMKDTNEKSNWLCIFYFKWIFGTASISYVAGTSLSTLFCIYRYGKFDINHVYVPYDLFLPWHHTSLSGYAVESVFSTIFGVGYFLMYGVTIVTFLSICFYLVTFSKMSQIILNRLDDPDKELGRNKVLIQFVRFHIATRDWFNLSVEIFKSYILIELIVGMSLMAISALQFEKQTFNVEFVMFSLAGSLGVSNLFLFCYYGKSTSTSFEMMSDQLYNANWINLSDINKKYFILMIANAQKPIFYHGFGIVLLNLETFTKCIKTVYTCYMLFKSMSE